MTCNPSAAGGIIEASIKLPGKSDTGGLWPAFWLMGNLGRATYEVRPLARSRLCMPVLCMPSFVIDTHTLCRAG